LSAGAYRQPRRFDLVVFLLGCCMSGRRLRNGDGGGCCAAVGGGAVPRRQSSMVGRTCRRCDRVTDVGSRRSLCCWMDRPLCIAARCIARSGRWSRPVVHRPSLTLAERHLRIVQRPFPRRIPHHRTVRQHARSPGTGGRLAHRVQHLQTHGSLDFLTPEAYRQTWCTTKQSTTPPTLSYALAPQPGSSQPQMAQSGFNPTPRSTTSPPSSPALSADDGRDLLV